MANVWPLGSRTYKSMSSVGGAWSVAFAAVTRIVTTKSFLGGTIVRANRSQVGSVPLTLKQETGFGPIHVRPAHVIVGESGEIVSPAAVAATTQGVRIRVAARISPIVTARMQDFLIFCPQMDTADNLSFA
ncbi:MAG: hypothetical protein DMF98_02835 [Acidobacteria bacterium]|nr:MAG: hypothetical protein DMF98_02835 [Acidobacteriota bacterium]